MGRPATCHCGDCGKCKHRVAQRRWTENNRERARQIAAKTRQRHAERIRARDRARGHRPGDPVKTRARRLVDYALSKGRLIRQPCEVCGKLEVQAHHDDYSKPLEVRWVCTKHHGELHRSVA